MIVATVVAASMTLHHAFTGRRRLGRLLSGHANVARVAVGFFDFWLLFAQASIKVGRFVDVIEKGLLAELAFLRVMKLVVNVWCLLGAVVLI